MLPCLLALLVTAAPDANAAAAATADKARVLILDLKNEGAPAAVATAVQETLAQHISLAPNLDVVSSEDMRRVLDVEAQKEALGCAEGTSSCLAEVADALGARYLVYGTVLALGDDISVSLSLFDAKASAALGRENVTSSNTAKIPLLVRGAATLLFARANVTLPAVVIAEEPGPDPVVWGGGAAAATGVVVGVTGLAVFAVASGDVANKAQFAEKKSAAVTRDVALTFAGAGAGLVVVGGGLLGAGLLVE